MGNCLSSSSSSDDVSLLHEAPSDSESFGDGTEPRVPAAGQEPPPPYRRNREQAEPMSGPSPCPLSEEEVRKAQRRGLIQHLPQGLYDGRGSDKKIRECVICMLDFVCGERVRFLPCMHTYHQDCIDAWLMRSLTCPTCMEPVDAALLSAFQTH